ncbi:MAG: 2Fe-2S iron-sulfur cluster binding domain-containing protein [Burkholderiales bacterium]|nr:2Fe-2S iron-sulfur cluster binding domain-containing protein [Burkholderiales bacterium]
MPIRIEFVADDGQRREVEATEGRSVMWAAVDNGVDGILADCGGCMTCATCHVIVPPEWAERLPPRSSDEEAMLEMTAAPREAGSRLSCQLVVTPELHGLTLRLPPTQY